MSTIGSGLKLSERAFLAWIHPRGIVAAAVCSVFALELVHAAGRPAEIPVGAEHLSAEFAANSEDLPAEGQGVGEGPATEIRAEAEKLVPVTFLVIVGTVTVYGLSVAPLARWLKVAEANPQGVLFAGANPLVRELAAVVQREGFPVLLGRPESAEHRRGRGCKDCPSAGRTICSEYAREELELAGIGRLLAMTPNDEVNSLAARELYRGVRTGRDLSISALDRPRFHPWNVSLHHCPAGFCLTTMPRSTPWPRDSRRARS